MDLRRAEKIPLLWSTEKGCLAKGLSFSAGGRKVPVCLQKKVNAWKGCTQ